MPKVRIETLPDIAGTTDELTDDGVPCNVVDGAKDGVAAELPDDEPAVLVAEAAAPFRATMPERRVVRSALTDSNCSFPLTAISLKGTRVVRRSSLPVASYFIDIYLLPSPKRIIVGKFKQL